MNVATLIEKIQELPTDKQAEVADFVDYLSERFGQAAGGAAADWSMADFSRLSMTQAMRGLEEEPDLYSEDDLKERWR